MGRLGRSTAYNLATIIANVATGFLLSVAAARLWPKSTFAGYLYLSWLATTLAIVATAAFPALAVRLVAERRARGDDGGAWRLLRGLAVLAGVGAIILGGAGIGIDRLTGWLDLTEGAGAVLALALAQTISTVVLHGAQGAGRFDLVCTRTLATVTVATIAATVGVAAGLPPAAVLLVLAAGHLLLAVAIAIPLARELGRADTTTTPSVATTLNLERRYFVLVTGLTLLDLVVWQKSELWFLRRWASANELANYGAAFQMAVAVVRMAPAALAGVLTPAFSALAARGDRDRVEPLYRHAVTMMALATSTLAVVAVFTSRSLLGVYGPSYVDAAHLLPILAAGFAVGNVSGIASTVFHGFGRADLLLKAALLLASTNLVLDVILIGRYGALGAALACSGAQNLSLPQSIVLLRRADGAGIPYAALGRILLAAGVALAVGGGIRQLLAAPGFLGSLALTAVALTIGAAFYLALGGVRDLGAPVQVLDPPPPTTPTPEVTIVVPSKNRPDYVERCVRQALGQEGPQREVIVVDSSDDERTWDLLAANFPEVRRIRVRDMPNNRHFAKNQGIRLARGRVICFLDDDSFSEPGWLARHLALYEDPTVGGAGGRIIDEVFAAGPVGETVGRMEPNGRLHLNFTRHTGTIVEVDQFIGCNMSFRAEALAHAGGFDLSYGGPNFMEETDLCIRVQRAGYRLLFDPDAVVLHANAPRDGGLERRALDPRGEFWSARSRAYFALKLLPHNFAVLRYNCLGFIKLHLVEAVRKRAPIHLMALALQMAGLLLGGLDWLVAGCPRVMPGRRYTGLDTH